VGFVSVPFLFAEPGYQSLYSSSIDRASGTVKSGTNRPYQLVRARRLNLPPGHNQPDSQRRAA